MVKTFGGFSRGWRIGAPGEDYLLVEIEEAKDQQLEKGSAPLQTEC